MPGYIIKPPDCRVVGCQILLRWARQRRFAQCLPLEASLSRRKARAEPSNGIQNSSFGTDREERNLPSVRYIFLLSVAELPGDADGESGKDRLRLIDNCDLGCPVFGLNTREADPMNSWRTSKQDRVARSLVRFTPSRETVAQINLSEVRNPDCVTKPEHRPRCRSVETKVCRAEQAQPRVRLGR